MYRAGNLFAQIGYAVMDKVAGGYEMPDEPGRAVEYLQSKNKSNVDYSGKSKPDYASRMQKASENTSSPQYIDNILEREQKNKYDGMLKHNPVNAGYYDFRNVA